MAIERKDIELAIRAKDLSSASFTQVRKAIQDVTDAIGAQAAAVRTGDTALDDLRQSYRQLELAGKTLASQQGLIDQFNRLKASVADFETRAVSARQKADAFGASLATKAEKSKRAEERLAALTRAADRSDKAFAAQKTRLEQTSQALEAVGIDVNDLANASKGLASSANQVGTGLTSLTTVISGYSKTVKEANAAEQNAKKIAEYKALSAETDKLTASYGRLSAANVALARTQGRGNAAASVADTIRPGAGATNLSQIATTAQAQARAVQDSLGKPVLNYLGLLQDLERSLKGVQDVAKQVDGFQAQANAVRVAGQAYAEQKRQFDALRAALRSNPNAENAAAVRAALPAYQQARATFEEQVRTLRVLREELKQAGVSTRDLAVTQRSLVDIAKNTSQAIKDLNRNFDQFGGSRREGAAGFLGLRPYEIQNLSFQINDFFTQLASGASVTQAFAQQVGQVAQIQPIWTRIVAFAPAFITLGAAIGVTTAALSRLYETTASNRNFAGNLTLLTGGATEGIGVTAERLTRLARALERLGFDFDEARKASLAFLGSGLAPDLVDRATEATLRLARARGIEQAEATRILTAALRGGQNAVIALREANIGLTAEQANAIVAAAGLRTEYERQQAVLNALIPTIRQADEQALSPLTRAINAAKEVWRGFLDVLGDTTAFQLIKAAIDGIVAGLGNLRTVGAVVGRALVAAFSPVLAVLDGIRNIIRSFGRQVDGGPPIADPGAAGGVGGGGGTQPLGGPSADSVRAQRDLRRRELETIRDDRRRSQRERLEANRRLLVGEPGGGFSGTLREEFPNADEAAIQQQRAQRQFEFQQRLNEEATRGSGAAAAAVRRDFQAIQQDLTNTVRIRDETIRGIQEDVASGSLTPAAAIERIQAAADAARPALQRLAEEARQFRDSDRGGDTVRRAAQDSLIAQAERQAGASGVRTGVRGVLQSQQQELQRALQERANLVQSVNALEQQGLITRAEAEERILRGYEATSDELRTQIDLQQQANDAARETGAISAAAYAATNAQLELYRANLQRLDPALARLRQGIENTFVQSATTAIDSLAKAAGDVLAGVTSLEEAFEAAGQAALQFVADVLKGIAQVIIQEQVLIAVQSIRKALSVGVGHAGGVVGASDFGSGRTRTVGAAWGANAPRYHSGGVVGLAPNEQMAILEKNEEVLTKDSPRNILNGGEAARSGQPAPGGGTGLRQVLAIGDQEIAAAMNGAAGEQVFMTWLKRNTPTIRQVLR